MMTCRSLEDHAPDYGAATIGTIDDLRLWDDSDDPSHLSRRIDPVIHLDHALSFLA